MVIRIDHKLRIARSELPPKILDLIVEALTIPNIQRQKAMEQNIYGWQELPETISLWDWDQTRSHLVMPRGFLQNLLLGLQSLGISYEVDDNRIFENNLSLMGEKIALRRWQEPALNAMRWNEQGIWKAPAGSGKTVAVLELIRRLNCPAIVIVNTKDILYQWESRAGDFLGEDYPSGLIGDKHFQVSDYLTIATAQTLHSRFDDLERNGFFDQFSLLCLDECHHATAETYNRLIDRFSCRYRIGVSATPDKTGDFALAENILGPIFHETTSNEVDTFVCPQIFKISTSFSFEYRGKVGRRPSNYPQLLQNLIADDKRNKLIAKSIMLNSGSHSLVVTKRLDHIDVLMMRLEELGYPYLMLKLTGNETSDARQAAIRHATSYPCVIFSTLADEALDIPRLDRLFLVFPHRNPGLIEQQIGRICRFHPGKIDAKVFDFVDMNVGPLVAQWRSRRLQVYHPRKYEIFPMAQRDILEAE